MSARMRLTRILNQKKIYKPKQAPSNKNRKWNIVRGDKVQVIGNHPERGKQGIIRTVLRKDNAVIVEGVNKVQHKVKGDADRGIPGRTVQVERSIPYNHVSLVDPVLGKPTRVIRKYLDDGTKVRIAKKSGVVIPRPEILKYRKRPVNSLVTTSDTLEEDVWEETFVPYAMRMQQQQQPEEEEEEEEEEEPMK